MSRKLFTAIEKTMLVTCEMHYFKKNSSSALLYHLAYLCRERATVSGLDA